MRELIHRLSKESKLYKSPIHGLKHWISVERNGLYLAKFNEANKRIVSLFSYLHDCQRENEFIDPEHGLRAAEYAHSLRGELLDLDDNDFDLLYFALQWHNHGQLSDNVTISTCWDADRLDIDRVGIYPDEKYLSSPEAKRIANDIDLAILDRQKSNNWDNVD